jgi:hypothetical protein
VSWERLNHELRHTDWDALLNGTEPEIGWKKFKEKLFNITDRFIKNALTDGQDPWFDSECSDAWRKKLGLHKDIHTSDTAQIAFSLARLGKIAKVWWLKRCEKHLMLNQRQLVKGFHHNVTK